MIPVRPARGPGASRASARSRSTFRPASRTAPASGSRAEAEAARAADALHCRVPISMVTAALGGGFDVPLIDGGKSRVKVPEGTQSGRVFRLHGKGMPVLRARGTGDMYVQVMVENPQKLGKRQKELLAEFERQSSRETHPESAGFFAKVKEFLDGFGNHPEPT